jgi:hypothetical protein
MWPHAWWAEVEQAVGWAVVSPGTNLMHDIWDDLRPAQFKD